MEKHLVVVLTEPIEGAEEAFNDYYENQHIDDVLATTGWTSGQRFKLSDSAGSKCPLPYLALYEADTDDPKSIIKTLNDTRSERVQSDALNYKTAGIWIFSPTGPKHKVS